VALTLHNATVVNPGVGLLEAQTVTIEGERISDVMNGPHDGEHALDIGGAFVLPGLTLSHTHTQLGLGGFEMFGEKYPGTERPPGVLMAVAIRTCQTLLDSGVTGYVGAACSHDIDVSLKIAIADGIIDGPRILACGRQVNTTANDNDVCGAKWWYKAGNLGIERFADGADGMVKAVRDEVRRGVEIIKIYPTGGHGVLSKTKRGLSKAELHAVVETAHDLGVKVRAHCAWRDAIEECVCAGVDVIDHGDEADQRCIELMAEHGTFWVPSMSFLAKAPMLPGAKEAWQNLVAMLPLAVEAGVKIAAPGDDYGIPGLMPHDVGTYGSELSIYVETVDIPADEVLRWATIHGAELLGAETHPGQIAPGAFADLIVLDADPRENIGVLGEPQKHLKAVIANGKLVRNWM